jgi:hypothetical protein
MQPLKYIFQILFLAFATALYSQPVSIDLYEPAGANARLPELYRANIVNSHTEALNCYLVATVTEDQDGTVGVIKSADFEVPVGSKLLDVNNYQQLEPLEVIQTVPEYEDFARRTNTLPPGSYEVCVAIYNSATSQQLDEDCYRLHVASVNPPYLISPQNKSVVHSDQPFFTWSPATPAPQSGSYAYTLLIVEMHNGQSPVAAIQSNPAWLQRQNLYTPVFQYPVAARALEKGKRYAWQVVAYENGNEVGASETWSFIYEGTQTTSTDTSAEEEEATILPPTYHALSKDPDGGYRLLNEPVLRFTYDNPYGSESVNVQLLDMNGNVVAANVLTKTQAPGINFNTINTSGTGVQREKLYKLKLVNGQHETYTMNFKIRKLEISKEDLQNIEIPGAGQ